MEPTTEISEKITMIRKWWIVLILIQFVLGIGALTVSSKLAYSQGGTYGSGPVIGIPGIVLGLVFFWQVLKFKNWARIALLFLSGLDVFICFGGIIKSFKLSGGGMPLALIGSLVGLAWGVWLFKVFLFDKEIKLAFSKGKYV